MQLKRLTAGIQAHTSIPAFPFMIDSSLHATSTATTGPWYEN